jgi:chromosome segregation ATPase
MWKAFQKWLAGVPHEEKVRMLNSINDLGLANSDLARKVNTLEQHLDANTKDKRDAVRTYERLLDEYNAVVGERDSLTVTVNELEAMLDDHAQVRVDRRRLEKELCALQQRHDVLLERVVQTAATLTDIANSWEQARYASDDTREVPEGASEAECSAPEEADTQAEETRAGGGCTAGNGSDRSDASIGQNCGRNSKDSFPI